MSSSVKTRKRAASAVNEEELSSRQSKLKKKGRREYVTPDLLDSTKGPSISYVKLSEEVFNAWCLCLNPEYKGEFRQSDDVDPITKNKIDSDCVYTPKEKDRIKPTKSCLAMYAINNTDAAFVTEHLMGDYGRELYHVPITAYSFCDALLYQISHDRNKYKAIHLLQQIAYFMVKFPEKCYDIAKPFLGEYSYESYVKNIFHGTKYTDVNVLAGVITMMWNLPITIVYPSKGSVPFYHQDTCADVILVNNEMLEPENYFCATRPANSNWRPVKGRDWSNEIKVLQNVKAAHANAEKKLRIRCVNKVVSNFNEVTTELNAMRDTLNLYEDQVKSLNEKIQTWKFNIGKMEGKQGVLRLKLLELGVDVNSLTKAGHAVEGVHYTGESTTSTTTSATMSDPHDIGQPVQVESPETSTVQADVHHTPVVSSTVVVSSTPASSISTSTTAIASTPESSTSTTGVQPAGQIVSLSTAQIAQLITPGASAVGGPQQIVNIGGQNVLISGSGPGTVGTSSVRYGKILKGIHKYFCQRCKRPFTQKESLSRHEQENCPMLQEKKKYKCDICGVDKFSSKQYLKEHQHEIHFKTPCYHCKGCGKGYFKHCNLSFHKKSCLAILVPTSGQQTHTQSTPPKGNPPTEDQNPTTLDTPGEGEANVEGGDTVQESEGGQNVDENQGNPLIGGKKQDDDNLDVEFNFSNPDQAMFLPNLC